MFFADRLQLDAPKRTKEGFLAVRARAARAGVYDYLGYEIDREGKHFKADQIVKIYRPQEEVFAKDAVHSFMLKPITDDHPTAPVTADNWKQHARGVAAGAMRDGDFLAFDLVLMDAAAIRAVDAGKRELSNGYTSELEIVSGTTPGGDHYDAIQRNIRGNHIALVKAGRAGPECRIGDAAICESIDVDVLDNIIRDGQTYRQPSTRDNFHDDDNVTGAGAANMNTITIDSIPFEMSDQAIAAVRKLQGQLADAQAKLATAETSVATLTTEGATKDAKITTLETQLKDSKLSPKQLSDAAAAFARTVEKAKGLGVTVTDSMDEPAIMKAAVLAKVGDASKDWSDEQIAASFATLTNDAKSADPVRQILRDGAAQITDTRAIRDAARSQRYVQN